MVSTNAEPVGSSGLWRERLSALEAKALVVAAEEGGRMGSNRVGLGQGQASLRTRDHAALVYWEEEELLRSIVPYLVEGLRCGDKVVHVSHTQPLPGIAAALAAAGVDVEGEQAAGRLALLRSSDAFFPGGVFHVEASIAGVQALADQAARDGFARVRFSVDMTYLLAQVPGIERGPEFEARVNEEVFARYPFVCICSFDGTLDPSDMLADVLATHPVLLVGGLPLANPYFQPWPALARDPISLERWRRRREAEGNGAGTWTKR